jgi:hypothetical protein
MSMDMVMARTLAEKMHEITCIDRMIIVAQKRHGAILRDGSLPRGLGAAPARRWERGRDGAAQRHRERSRAGAGMISAARLAANREPQQQGSDHRGGKDARRAERAPAWLDALGGERA